MVAKKLTPLVAALTPALFPACQTKSASSDSAESSSHNETTDSALDWSGTHLYGVSGKILDAAKRWIDGSGNLMLIGGGDGSLDSSGVLTGQSAGFIARLDGAGDISWIT